MTATSTEPAVDPAAVRRSTGGLSRWQRLIGVLGLVVVFWVGDRLYDVISSGGIGPGADHGPSGGTPTTEPVGTDTPTPGGGSGGEGGHDPSQFDHG
jgi:hypothetical protein